MGSVNSVVFSGNLTRDPDYKSLNNGNSVVDFSVAVNYYNNRDKKENVSFVNCKSFGVTADFVNKYFKKGSGIIVYGCIRTDKWEDKETNKTRYKDWYLIERVDFSSNGKKKDGIDESGEGQANSSEQKQTQHKTKTRQEPASFSSREQSSGVDSDDEWGEESGGGGEDDDLPF